MLEGIGVPILTNPELKQLTIARILTLARNDSGLVVELKLDAPKSLRLKAFILGRISQKFITRNCVLYSDPKVGHTVILAFPKSVFFNNIVDYLASTLSKNEQETFNKTGFYTYEPR